MSELPLAKAALRQAGRAFRREQEEQERQRRQGSAVVIYPLDVAAKMLSVSLPTVYKLIREKRLRAVQLSRLRRGIRSDSLQGFIDASEQEFAEANERKDRIEAAYEAELDGRHPADVELTAILPAILEAVPEIPESEVRSVLRRTDANAKRRKAIGEIES